MSENMNKPIDFINRQKELNSIGKLIQLTQPQLIYINGDGEWKDSFFGRNSIFFAEKNISATCVKTIDFDDITFQFTDNLIHLLLEHIPFLTIEQKIPIYQELESLFWMERIGDSYKTKNRQNERVIDALADLLNNISPERTPCVSF